MTVGLRVSLLVVVALLVVVCLVGARRIARQEPSPSAATTPTSPPAPAPKPSLSPVERRIVENIRAKVLSLAPDMEIRNRLASTDSDVLKANDIEAYISILKQPRSNASVVILRPEGQTYEVALWLPGLRGMPNLFTYSAEEPASSPPSGR